MEGVVGKWRRRGPTFSPLGGNRARDFHMPVSTLAIASKFREIANDTVKVPVSPPSQEL